MQIGNCTELTPSVLLFHSGPIVYGVGSAQSSSGTASSTSLPPVAAAATMASSLRRSNRLLSAAPYNASMRIHNRSQRQPQQQPQQPQLNYSANDHDDYSPMDSAGISSTAKVILDTLEKMSTPIKDAQRIPMPAARAETRRAIAEQLLDRPSSALGGGGGGSAGSSPTTSESSSSYSRRRPRLGRTTPVSISNASGQLLNGPPLRTLFSPVSSSFRGSGAPRCERNGDLTYSASAPIKRLSGDESILGTKSSKTVPSAASTSSPWQKKSTFPFSVPALQPSAKLKEGGGAASSGKIRTKVGEKAKMRAEKALFDDAGAGSDEGPPPHLKNATETINPFMKMNSMPQFNFQQESIISNESGRNNSKRKDEDSTDVPKKLKTSSSINPLPVSSNSVNFSFPTTASELPVENKAAAVKAAPPSGTPLPTGAATFVFTRPLCVSHSPASALEGAGRFSYAFSVPTKPGGAGASSQSDLNRKEASSPQSLISPSSRGANLPDLTSGASSSGGTVKKMTESQPKQVGVARAAVTLKSASVMDILSGNGDHFQLHLSILAK